MQVTLYITLVEEVGGSSRAYPHRSRALHFIGHDPQLTPAQASLWKDLSGSNPTEGCEFTGNPSQLRERIAHLLQSRKRDGKCSAFAVGLSHATVKVVVRYRASIEPKNDGRLRSAIRAHDSGRWSWGRWSWGRWSWEKIDACITGKYADLDDHGQQGVQFLGVTRGFAHCIAHIGATYPGHDVTLNLAKGVKWETAREKYLDQAGEILATSSVPGEWSGDDWYLHTSVPFKVRLRASNRETAAAIRTKLDKVLAPAERELRAISAALDELCGWKDAEGKPCKEGQPPSGAAGWKAPRANKRNPTSK